MQKKVALIVRDRQDEALRVAIGLTLMDDSIDVYVMDKKVEDTKKNRLNLETMEMMDMKIFTNFRGNEKMEYLPVQEIAGRLLEYDIVLPY